MTVVSRSKFQEVLGLLKSEKQLALDTETTGLRPWNGDRLFSIIIANETDEYYFNFQAYDGLEPQYILPSTWLSDFQELFNVPSTIWFLHNAKFDMAFLYREDLEIRGTLHCTQAIARVEYNEHLKYSLAECLTRIGLAKDDAVERYIKEYKLYERVPIPGKKVMAEFKHYDKVPWDLIVPYACKDARGTFALGVHEIGSIEAQSLESSSLGLPTLFSVLRNERELTTTVFRMESCGVRLDRDYTLRAAQFEHTRSEQAISDFKKETGEPYAASPKLFTRVFQSDRERWQYTEKGNASFESDVIREFTHPAAKLVLEIRNAKSKLDFYNGFIYHCDDRGYIHPSFRQDGAAHGRFSSSNPNFQNLTSEELGYCRACGRSFETICTMCSGCQSDQLCYHEYLTRRSLIPTPGYVFFMPDYDQMEYRLMLELACRMVGKETPLVQLIKTGLDVHSATAHIASSVGVTITREEAKTSNFLTIYGGGNQKLADGLKCSLDQAKKIRQAIFQAAPEMTEFVNSATATAKVRGFVFNWFGRKCHFPNSQLAYRAPNYLVAGGCADVVKIAMNKIDNYLWGKKSRMILTVHDELCIEVHESELAFVPLTVVGIMESVFPTRYLPLTCTAEWSEKSLADKRKGYPV